jgi:hypothetical protein
LGFHVLQRRLSAVWAGEQLDRDRRPAMSLPGAGVNARFFGSWCPGEGREGPPLQSGPMTRPALARAVRVLSLSMREKNPRPEVLTASPDLRHPGMRDPK